LTGGLALTHINSRRSQDEKKQRSWVVVKMSA